MSLISASIEVDVPITFANREWSSFMWRLFVGHYTRPIDEVERPVGGDESEADRGVVRFETKGDRLTKVSVELDYSTPGIRTSPNRRRGECVRDCRRTSSSIGPSCCSVATKRSVARSGRLLRTLPSETARRAAMSSAEAGLPHLRAADANACVELSRPALTRSSEMAHWVGPV